MSGLLVAAHARDVANWPWHKWHGEANGVQHGLGNSQCLVYVGNLGEKSFGHNHSVVNQARRMTMLYMTSSASLLAYC